MNIFVIHSGADTEVVEKHIGELKKLSYSLNPLVLRNGNVFWKHEAAQKIKKCQIAIFFVGENSHASPNIEWEIHTAMKYGKPIYTVKLDESFRSHPSLIVRDAYSGLPVSYDKEVTFDMIAKLISDHEKGDYKIFNQDIDKINSSVLLEQYKAFLQTSEDLVSRRQNVNSFYISVNSSLVAIFSFISALEMEPLYKLSTSVILTMVGIILSVSWIKTLISYGDLNSSKMKIISCIEKQLPASLYDAEWAALSDKLNKRKYVSFTNNEKNIPLLFIVIYICVFILYVIFILKGLF